MSASFKAPFKIVRCRYFDDRGRSLNPPCRDGRRCRFVHPNDAQWKTARKHESNRNLNTTTASDDYRDARPVDLKIVRRTNKSRSASPRSRIKLQSSPLASQADLFHRCKYENDLDHKSPRMLVQDVDRAPYRGRARDNYFIRTHHSPQTGRADNASGRRAYSSRSSLDDTTLGSFAGREISNSKEDPFTKVESDKFKNHGKRRVSPSANPADDVLSSYVAQIQTNGSDGEARKTSKNDPLLSQVKEHRESLIKSHAIQRLVELFKSLGQASDQLAQDTASHEIDEKKLRTYQSISATLSGVSQSASIAVAPTLAGIILNHAHSSAQVRTDLSRIEEIWQDVFEVVLSEISQLISTRLDDALVQMKTEGQRVVEGILGNPTTLLEKGSGESAHPAPSMLHKGGRTDSRSTRNGDFEKRASIDDAGDLGREAKRPRLITRWGSQTRVCEKEERRNVEDFGQGSGLKDMIDEMKDRIEKQAQSLESLATENLKLKKIIEIRTQGSVILTSGAQQE